MVRFDLRTNLQTRPITAELGVVGISDSDGSAIYAQGKTKVLATVSGIVQ